MAFIPAAASFRERTEPLLSADNAIPDRHIVIDMTRRAASLIGLTPPVIATLDTLISCLPPKRTHHTVFASNATLTFRRNGISDRTIRRHVVILQDAGLLARHDSPNRKRFTKANSHAGTMLRFGFDLTPLYDALPRIAALAAEATAKQEQIAYIRTKIRAAANDLLITDPHHPNATQALRILRRKLTLDACETLLTTLTTAPLAAEHTEAATAQMSAEDSQNVRHHQNSKKELIDKEPQPQKKQHPFHLTELLAACPEARQYAVNKIESFADVIAHARILAPMIGIDDRTYQAAQDQIGPLSAATTIWAMMQFHQRIKQAGAYFRAITTGQKSIGFDPVQLIRQLAARQHCPRTI
ncbi:plasmid replication protein RepC [Yoonia sp.]|uniref:plasmid replication protein RepC n=1 Tax=Yoonia sp. TaxID=2212373 RepID=UPI00391CE5A0